MATSPMDALNFVSSIVASTIWPLLVLIVLSLFRKPLSELMPNIQTLKFRDIEASFKSMSLSGQSILFLDGVARKDQWTFYKKAREGEREIGQAFSILVEDLLKVEKAELLKKLREWLNSGENNCIWFSSEICGYFKVKELEPEIYKSLPSDVQIDLLPHQLNCLWAYARINDITQLTKLLKVTKSIYNQEWLIFMFEQMYLQKHISAEDVLFSLDNYLSREDLADTNRGYAAKTIETIMRTSSVNNIPEPGLN